MSLKFIFILPFYTCLGLTSGLLSSHFPTKPPLQSIVLVLVSLIAMYSFTNCILPVTSIVLPLDQCVELGFSMGQIRKFCGFVVSVLSLNTDPVDMQHIMFIIVKLILFFWPN